MTGRDKDEDGPQIVSYGVRPEPAPIQVSQGSTPARAAVRTVLTNHTGQDVALAEVAFAFPVGEGPGDLTANPRSVEPYLEEGEGGASRWILEADPDRSGVFLLTPRRSAYKLRPGDELTVSFAQIQVNSAVGTSRLTITETVTEGGPPRPAEWPLAKVPAGFTAGDFRPQYILVKSGTGAVLTWRGENRPGAVYTMLHAGEPVDVTQVKRWESPPLHQDTAFTLLVEVTEGDGTAEYAMSTLVTLTPVAVEFALDEEVFVRECTAETDGLLIGHVLADEDITDPAAPAPTLAVTVTAQGVEHHSSVQSRAASPLTGEDRSRRLTAVVPRGAAVRITRDDRTAYTHRLTWIPFGTGELRAGTGA